MKKHFIQLLFFTSILINVFSQQTLSNLNTSWTTVVPGKVIAEPQLTSYGFCLLTDAQSISGYTNSGKLLWEKYLPKAKKAFAATLKDDFYAVITNNGQTLNLLNPSGYIIWSYNTDFIITGKPISGKDGRFFVFGDTNIQCFGINGVSKWKIETPQQSSIHPLELNDGSIVAFLQQEQNNKTVGLRISPFGEVLEEIIFVNVITKAFSCSEGILLNFADGTAGLFSVEDNTAVNKWVLLISEKNELEMKHSTFVVSDNKNESVFLLPSENDVQVNQINLKNGKISHSFFIENINGFSLTCCVLNKNGIFITDNKNAYFYSMEANELFSAKMPASTSSPSWNYLFYNNDNYLIFCETNWSVNAYKTIQSTSQKNTAISQNRKYNSFIKSSVNYIPADFITSINRKMISKERFNSILTGNYGYHEIEYMEDILSTCADFKNYQNSTISNDRTIVSIFDSDSTGTSKFLLQLPQYFTVETSSYTAEFLQKLKNRTYIQSLLNGISKSGYDPYGKILNAISTLSEKVTSKDDAIICASCDAVYAICLFMGRPAFNSKGKDILATYIAPAFSIKSRNYARNTLQKISELDL